MEDDKRKKWREHVEKLMLIEKRIRELFPLAEPPESPDWQKTNCKFLTEDEAEELVKLAAEARSVRKQMNQL
jgi:hypothetical protein